MRSFARTDTSVLGRWWWTVDRWTLAALVVLMFLGVVLILAVSPAAAERIGNLTSFQLAQRQLLFLAAALVLVIGVSLLEPRTLRRLAVAGLLLAVVLLAATLVVGPEIKGATRWLSLAGVSFQASELAKPCFAVVAAWMISAQKTGQGLPGTQIALALWVFLVALLLLQPDVGQSFVVSVILGVEMFVAGLPIAWVVSLGLVGAGGLVGAYVMLPHVAARIDGFLDPAAGDRYQVERSIEAFANGGLFGRGPGEGTVKALLPDAHSDFIFAVAGEEFGVLACLVIVALFAFVVLRGFARLLQESSLFVLLACSGLLAQFGMQALINMASALHLIPTKGMTLPFISYGGSSLIGLGLAMGMVLALTRRRVGGGAPAMSRGGIERAVLAAGGTGGHMFPAQALARELIDRGRQVILITDRRGGGFGPELPQVETYRISAAALAGRGLLGKARGALQLGLGVLQAGRLLKRLRADAVVGFGGYASVPTVLAARRLRLRIVLHEQNAVLGRANRLLAPRAHAIATSFDSVEAIAESDRARVCITGNPVRPAIAALGHRPYALPDASDRLRLLVIGGSQGAAVFNEVVPAGLCRLAGTLHARLAVSQQVAGTEPGPVAATYRDCGIACELKPFFEDMPERLAAAHLVICRAGASTVAELAAAGRPSLMVPYPFATDDHQTVNARRFAEAGGGWVMAQPSFTPESLAERLDSLFGNPALLARASRCARAAGREAAAARLADVVCGLRGDNGDQQRPCRGEAAA